MLDLQIGDNLEILKKYPDNYFDSIITDPPYGISFMNKKWDYSIPSIILWEECLRVAKPGATLLSFGGTRTFHRIACYIEDAGWEIYDSIMIWCFGQGFPKAFNISKAIDKEKGLEREVIEEINGNNRGEDSVFNAISCGIKGEYTKTLPHSDLAKQFDGWYSALKPAYEPIIVARKKNDGTFAQNAEKWGVSGLWIDGTRIPTLDDRGRPNNRNETFFKGLKYREHQDSSKGLGRWPANMILDESSAEMLDREAKINGCRASDGDSQGTEGTHQNSCFTGFKDAYFGKVKGYGKEVKGPSRFFYTAKASRSEREEGLEDFNKGNWTDGRDAFKDSPHLRKETSRKNIHATVKPLSLMEYLCKLTKTPSGGIVLDPFMGSGTTGIACLKTNRNFVGIEINPEYFEIAKARINHWNPDAEKDLTQQQKPFTQKELF